MVAAIQASILLGALFGGALLDAFGIAATFLGSAGIAVLAMAVIGSGKGLVRPVDPPDP
ncbi:hypothetical protein [Wenxinia saemankumensis]|uniref:hypothetical protein n=1 Tax=Wenxinia saemankumensis TaxID=1447782 RepID=UPI00147C3D58|nr:hypothetical protein [Wenxinia saemankumensis]